MPPFASGALGNGWPFPPGVDASTGTLERPPATVITPGQRFRWFVPSGYWWQPLLWTTTSTCGGGAPPWTTFEIVIDSNYWGAGNTPSSDPAAIFHVGFSPQATQGVHLELGVDVGVSVMAPADATQLAYAGVGIPPMLLGPLDLIDFVYFDKGGGIVSSLNFVTVQYDASSGDDGGGQPSTLPATTPLIA